MKISNIFYYMVYILLFSNLVAISLESDIGKSMIYKIGHRGACGYEPENTLRSFQKALDLGVDMVEFDVHICKSGQIVVIHDEKVDRTTNGKGCVKDMNIDELKELDAGKGEKIPTLLETLDLIDRRAIALIELKGKGTAIPVLKLLEEYVQKKGWSYKDFLIISFMHDELFKLKELNNNFNIGLLFSALPKKRVSAYWFDQNVFAVDLSFKNLTSKQIKELHEKNINVFVYTVNKKEDINTMIALGVDAIASDYPDRL